MAILLWAPLLAINTGLHVRHILFHEIGAILGYRANVF